MKQYTIIAAVAALLIGGVGVYALVEKDNDRVKEMDHSMMSEDSTEQDSMSMENMAKMDHSAMMVSSEREFVTGMIPHHQEAVDTAKEVLARGGTTPEVRTLAQEIVVAQEAEIAQLKAWHEAWYGEAYVANNTYQSMMRDLSQLSGADLDKRFLEDMIPHHMGAIMMAQSVRPYVEHQEVTDLADAIMSTQTTEIELMRNLLQTM
jgi:uncharacterized protein (DUF305 family)